MADATVRRRSRTRAPTCAPTERGLLMSRAIVVCRPEVPIEAAVRAMTERRSRSIVVMDQAGAVAGVITGQDLLGLNEQQADGPMVKDLMTREVRTITPDASIRGAADVMLRYEGPPAGRARP